MSEHRFSGFELLPASTHAKQLFVLLHGAGATPSQLAPFAHQLHKAFPDAALLIPDTASPAGSDRHRFAAGITEEDLPAQVAAAMPALHSIVREAQDRLNILPTDTALGGFSEGAIMALEFSGVHDGAVGRCSPFAGDMRGYPTRRPNSPPFTCYMARTTS